MQIQLIKGDFEHQDAMELIDRMIQMKIKYHENKIDKNLTEEDIKNRESKIKLLQNEAAMLREKFGTMSGRVKVDGVISVG